MSAYNKHAGNLHLPFAGFGMQKFQRPGYLWQPCHERPELGCPEDKPWVECCKTNVCELCLTLSVYGKEDQHGIAVWDPEYGAYIGTVRDIQFIALQRPDGYGRCYLDIYIDDVFGSRLVKTFAYCPEYGLDLVECRKPGGIVPFDYRDGYEGVAPAVLEFSTIQPKRLRRTKEYGECADYYCGRATCTCEKLCLTWPSRFGPPTVVVLEWDGKGDCELGWHEAAWYGEHDYTPIRVVLGKDPYGYCVLSLQADGEEYTVRVDDTYKDMRATWQIPSGPYDYQEASVRCLVCNECEPVDLSCCDLDEFTCANLPQTLYVRLFAKTDFPGSEGCQDFDGKCFPIHWATDDGWWVTGHSPSVINPGGEPCSTDPYSPHYSPCGCIFSQGVARWVNLGTVPSFTLNNYQEVWVSGILKCVDDSYKWSMAFKVVNPGDPEPSASEPANYCAEQVLSVNCSPFSVGMYGGGCCSNTHSEIHTILISETPC